MLLNKPQLVRSHAESSSVDSPMCGLPDASRSQGYVDSVILFWFVIGSTGSWTVSGPRTSCQHPDRREDKIWLVWLLFVQLIMSTLW